MKTVEIIKAIQRLPISKRIYVVEKTMHSIRKSDDRNQIKMAADALYEDYKSDKELTLFTKLDYEDFYETR